MSAAMTVACGQTANADINPPQISSFGFQSNIFQLTVNSSNGAVYTVQVLDGSVGYWVEGGTSVGNGAALTFSDTNISAARFYRVAGAAVTNLALFPSIPLLDSGAVSLPDAMIGTPYHFDISPRLTGMGPCSLQFSNSLPDGISAKIIGNNTSQALLRLSSVGTNLVPGERQQFTVTVSDSSGKNITHTYDLRVVAPPPAIMTMQFVLKAGETTNYALEAVNGSAPLSWTFLSGTIPEGITNLGNGAFMGTPTANAAELNETGLYTNVVLVADSFTDRVTGQLMPRASARAITQLVRLSYRLNLFVDTATGPSLNSNCSECHNSGFLPDFSTDQASVSLIYVYSGSGGDCGPFWQYVRPTFPGGSLIYRKVTDAPCGNQMPNNGPYLSDIQANRIARWITELTASDSD